MGYEPFLATLEMKSRIVNVQSILLSNLHILIDDDQQNLMRIILLDSCNLTQCLTMTEYQIMMIYSDTQVRKGIDRLKFIFC